MAVTNNQCHVYRQDIAKGVILEVEEAVILITLRHHFTEGSDSQQGLCGSAWEPLCSAVHRQGLREERT